jgi:hypothetical protein
MLPLKVESAKALSGSSTECEVELTLKPRLQWAVALWVSQERSSDPAIGANRLYEDFIQ